MSKFFTKIPTQIEEFLNQLPKNATVYNFSFDHVTKNIIVQWEHQPFESGLTVPFEFPMEDVKSKRPPKGVRNASKLPNKVVAPEPLPEPPKAPEPSEPPPVYLTKDEYENSIAGGKTLEFMGVESIWKDVDRQHDYTAGYFYRLRQ